MRAASAADLRAQYLEVAEAWAGIAAAIPAPGDPRDERDNDLLVASMSFHFPADKAGRDEYDKWKEAHQSTLTSRDEYRAAATAAENAWKEAEKADREYDEAHEAVDRATTEFFWASQKDPEEMTEREKSNRKEKEAQKKEAEDERKAAFKRKQDTKEDAIRKSEEADKKRKENNKKLIDEERIANQGLAPNCSPQYAELCIEDAWDECFYCETWERPEKKGPLRPLEKGPPW